MKSLSYSLNSHPHVSLFRQVLNFIGCLLIFPLYRAAAVNTYYPATVDLLISICLAEFCRFTNEGRRIALNKSKTQPREKDDVEKHAALGYNHPGAPTCEAMASIVGWREDPDLWERCLESYKTATGCKFVLVGIDGNDVDDKEMVDIFRKVYPQHSLVISMDEPLGEIANAVRSRELAIRRKSGTEVDEDEINDICMQTCINIARQKLDEQLGDSSLVGSDGIKYILVNQRHLHKKGIMFTAFIFSTIIADILGIEIVWTSDSDTIVLSDSIEGTINTIAGDPKAGGASSALVVHNASDNAVTRLASVVYWCELYLTRSLPASVGASDCQSGPSAAFRLSAIQPILVPWYNQTVFGKKMIVNEDRHLTTLLLLRGWKVIYAGDIMTETETPTTFVRWIRQQVRWARAQHIESLLIPKVYIMNHPFLFLSALRRELAHLIVFVQCFLYLFANKSLLSFNMPDIGLRIVGMTFYNFLRNTDRQSGSALFWMVPGLLFYNVPLPAVQAWSLVTLTADTWGNSMRSSSERAKKDSLRKRWFESGFFVLWAGIVGAILAKWMSTRLQVAPIQLLLWEFVAAALSSFIAWQLTINE